jgi:glycosyltransferase involved in cell wall biosynthesis
LKIILVIPTLKQGGAERVMSELANEFSNKKHEVHLCLLAGGEHFYTLNKNIKVYNFGFENKGFINKLFLEIKIFFKLRNLFKSIKPNFILSFMTKYNIFTIIASSFLKVNVFISDRNNPKKSISYSLRLLRKLTYKYATGIIAQTYLSKKIIQKITKHKNIEVIPNPLKNIIKYPDIRREKIILNVGRMIPEKGQKYLIESFSKIENNNWKIVILGDGPLYEALQEKAKELNLSEKVIMIGSVKNIDKWLAKSSIFAFPSISEGFPNALVEGMSSGLPCISFDCDTGPRDIIHDGENGYLIPLKDIDIFSERLEILMNNENLRIEIGEKATEIQNSLEINNITNRFLTFCSKDNI